MSMAGGNPSLTLDFAVNTTMLDRALTDADRRIVAATKGTGGTVDRMMDSWSKGIVGKLQAAIGAGFAMKIVDDALRKVVDGIKSGKTGEEIGMALAEGIAEGLKSVPLVGPIGELAAMIFDPLMGGAMGDEEARRKTMEHYARMAAGEEALRQIRLRSASEEEALAEWKRMEIEKLDEQSKRAQDSAYDYTERLNEKAFENAIKRAKDEEEARSAFAPSLGPNAGELARSQRAFEMQLRGASERDIEAARLGVDPAAFMDRIQTEASTKRQQEISRAYADAVKAISAEADKKLAEAQARRDAEAKRRQDEFAREQEKARSEQERMLKEQEAAYDRFIQGNAQDAIRMIEAQIAAMTASAAPSRAERLAEIMAGMDTGLATADTALGAFTFAQGDAVELSRQMLAKATDQLDTLLRIEDLQRQLVDIREGLN